MIKPESNTSIGPYAGSANEESAIETTTELDTDASYGYNSAGEMTDIEREVQRTPAIAISDPPLEEFYRGGISVMIPIVSAFEGNRNDDGDVTPRARFGFENDRESRGDEPTDFRARLFYDENDTSTSASAAITLPYQDPSSFSLTTSSSSTTTDKPALVSKLSQEHLQTQLQAFVNMMKGIVGAAAFAFPWGFQEAGMIGAMSIIFITAWACYQTIRILIECKQRLEMRTGLTYSYSTLASHVLQSRHWGSVIRVATSFSCLGAGAGFLAFLTGLLTQRFPAYLTAKSSAFYLMPVLIALSLVRRFKYMAFTSIIGDLGFMLAMISVIFDGITTHSSSLTMPIEQLKLFSFKESLMFIGPCVFLFTIHYCVLPLEGEMKDRREVYSSLRLALLLSAMIVSGFGSVGYVLFSQADLVIDPITGKPVEGCEDSVCENIIKNLPKGPLKDIVLFALFFDILFSYAFLTAPAREYIELIFLSRSTAYDRLRERKLKQQQEEEDENDEDKKKKMNIESSSLNGKYRPINGDHKQDDEDDDDDKLATVEDVDDVEDEDEDEDEVGIVEGNSNDIEGYIEDNEVEPVESSRMANWIQSSSRADIKRRRRSWVRPKELVSQGHIPINKRHYNHMLLIRDNRRKQPSSSSSSRNIGTKLTKKQLASKANKRKLKDERDLMNAREWHGKHSSNEFAYPNYYSINTHPDDDNDEDEDDEDGDDHGEYEEANEVLKRVGRKGSRDVNDDAVANPLADIKPIQVVILPPPVVTPAVATVPIKSVMKHTVETSRIRSSSPSSSSWTKWFQFRHVHFSRNKLFRIANKLYRHFWKYILDPLLVYPLLPMSNTMRRNWIRSFIVLFTVIVAAYIPRFTSIIGLVGGLTDTLQSLVLPPIIYVALMDQEGIPLDVWKKRGYWTMACVGSVLMVSTTYMIVTTLFLNSN